MDETRVMFAVVVHLSLLCAKTVFGMEEALISLGCLVLVTLYLLSIINVISFWFFCLRSQQYPKFGEILSVPITR